MNAALSASADTTSMHLCNYTVTLTSDGPTGSLALGNNGCGLVSWDDTSFNVNFVAGNSSHAVSISRTYVATFTADPGFAFTTVANLHSDSYGNGFGSYVDETQSDALTDLANNTIAPFTPCVSTGPTLKPGCTQEAYGIFDENGNECCLVVNFDTASHLNGTGPIAVPGNGFKVTVNAALNVGGPPEGNLNYGFGGFPGHGSAAFELGGVVSGPAPAPAPAPATGDIYVSGPGGIVKRYKPDGTLTQTLSINRANDQLRQMEFAPNGQLYVADQNGGDDSNSSNAYFFDQNAAPQPYTNYFNTVSASGLVFNSSGTGYLGATDSTGGQHPAIFAVDSNGNQTAMAVAADSSGYVHYIDLAADQCTAYYSLGGTFVSTFDVCLKQGGSTFNQKTLPGNAQELRIRPNGEVLVATGTSITRLDSKGNQIGTYSVSSGAGAAAPTITGLALDPDGATFWAGDPSGNIYHFDFGNSTQLSQFSTGLPVGGLTLFREIRAATNPGPSCTLSVMPTGGAAPLQITATGSCTGSAINNLDFGDGTVLQDSSSGTHTYTSAGTYTVKLTGTDNNGVSNIATQTVTVAASQPPTCTLNVDKNSGNAPLTVQFTASCSTSQGSLSSASLTFGDGQSQALSCNGNCSGNFTHTYQNVGNYTATVSTMNAAGQTGSASQTIMANSPFGPPMTGSLYVSGKGGIVERFTPQLQLAQVLSVNRDDQLGQMEFGRDGQLYVTDFFTGGDSGGPPNVWYFDQNSAAHGYSFSSNTVATSGLVFSRNGFGPGNGYLGAEESFPGQPAAAAIVAFQIQNNQTAMPVPSDSASYVHYVDLAADQCSVYYTVGSTNILRYDVCAQTPLKNFNVATLPGGAQELRIRPNGEVLVAAGSSIVRLDASGNQIGTYSPGGGASISFTALGLDPDGATFWAGDSNAVLYHFDIATGKLLADVGTDLQTAEGITLLNEIRAATNPGPSCTLSVMPTGGAAPLQITATGSCTGSAINNLDFGDGTVLQDSSSGTHTYTSAGTYTVKLTGTDSNGVSNVATQTVNVSASQAPSCAPSVMPNSGQVPLNVNVSANCTDSSGTINSTTINFGDGSATVNGTSASHTYTQAGSYTVTATATNTANQTGTGTQTVTATAAPQTGPSCSLTANPPNGGDAPLMVAFQASCTPGSGSLSTATLSFGDNTSQTFNCDGSCSLNVNHTYQSAGSYSAVVSTTDSNGLTGSANQTISVSQPPRVISVSPQSLQDKQRLDGQSTPVQVLLTNTSSTQTVHFTGTPSSSNPAYTVTTDCSTLAPGASCHVFASFTASQVCQAQSTNVTLQDDDPGGSLSISINGFAADNNFKVQTLNDTGVDANALVQALIGSGVQVSNVKFTGAPLAAGLFSTNSNIIGFPSGVVLSSGNVRAVAGPNCSTGISTGFGLPGDTQLDTLLTNGDKTMDASVLEFDFVPTSSVLTFQYVFASDEYNEFVYDFNDVFGFFVNGQNVALIPGTNTPVSINNVNNGNPNNTSMPATNPQFYRDNDMQYPKTAPIDTEMDGLTVVFTATAQVTPNQVNHIKLAVADAIDDALDSVVFIKGGSIVSQPLTLSPASLAFGNQALGTTSAAQTVTIANNTANTVHISSIAASAGFTQTNNCPAALPPVGQSGSSCTANVSFQPTALGMVTGQLTVTDDAPTAGSQQVATLSGTGTAGTAPVCTLQVSPTTGTAPLPVTATGNCTSSNGTLTTTLDFGDQSTPLTTSSGTHTYTQAGTFTVTLTAKDSSNQTGMAVQTVTVSASPFPVGVYVGVSGGNVMQFASDGSVLKTLSTGLGGTVAGMAFDKSGTLYATDLTAGNISRFDLKAGTLLGTFGSGYNCQPETIVFDGAGNAYVGQQGCAHQVLKFDPAGNLLAKYDVQREETGSDDIELSADECTLLYTSEGPSILRYDVCRNQQLTPFATGLNKALTLRVLPDGGVIVADLIDVIRLSSTGQKVMTYTAPGEQCLYPVTLDQDGVSFWVADYCSSNIYHFDLASGKVLSKFNTGTPSGTIFGLAIAGSGLNVAGVGSGGTLTASPQTASLTAGQSVSFTVSFTPNAASAGRTLVLSCAGLPVGLTCTFNPATITLGAAGTTTTATMTITMGVQGQLAQVSATSPWMMTTWFGIVPAMVLVGLRSPRRRRTSVLYLGCIIACVGLWASCGGGGMSKTTTTPAVQQGSYNVIVVGNASGLQASTTVNVTVH